jgi:fatty acyl-CoA reductase
VITEALTGRRIAITGSTGFLGTALVERLLRSVPDCHLTLLVRSGRRSAAERIRREVLKNDAFDLLRRDLGDDGFQALTDSQIQTFEADITKPGLGLDESGREALAACDIVIHSAAAVAFDSPLDLAVRTNLLGPVNMAATLNDLGSSPHLVSVSTAYVAGSRKGAAPEELLSDSPFALDIDWRDEADSALRLRTTIEDRSRTPEQLATFRKGADDDLGAAGTTALSARREQLRQRWVRDELIESGRARAGALGFPDAYAMTKALAEQALVETRGDLQVSIVRPSIIESAYSEPFPGWIRGFRMAEPIILAYARGVLKDFPAVPEGIMDVIPVDKVAATLCAVAARGPQPDPEVFNVASGSLNPFKFENFHEWAFEWFGKNPLYDDKDQPIAPPRWSYPSRARVQTQLERARKAFTLAESAIRILPVRGDKALVAADLEEKREEIERAQSYIELYGMYVECEATFGTERLMELWDQLSEDDRLRFDFDPNDIDWHKYLTEIHLPSVIAQARVKSAPSGQKGRDRYARLRGQVLSEDRHIAAFDLENTLIASNVVASWGWLATRRLSPRDRARLILKAAVEGPGLLAMDRRDRSDFLRHFYRRYEGAPIGQLEEDSQAMFNDFLLTQSFPAAIRRVRAHRAAGHRTVLITGALDFVVEPMSPLFDDIICARLEVAEGRYMGRMEAVPPTGESRAQLLRDYADAQGLKLSESVAYADSTSDLPMLEAVGFPVAVNPETKLATLARRRGWLVEVFEKSAGAPKKLLPLGPRRSHS